MSKAFNQTCIILSALGLTALFVLVLPGQQRFRASAQATISVDTLDDEFTADGDCSLREAIHAANENSAADACLPGEMNADTINFSVNGTIYLTMPLTITDGGPLLIDGSEAITVSGGESVRIFSVFTDTVLTLNGLTLINGLIENEGGGAIDNYGTLTVTNSTLSNNSALDGGAIYNPYGSLVVISSTLDHNSTIWDGGGIYTWSGTITIRDSILHGNSARTGGAIVSAYGKITVDHSYLYGNNANLGGGIFSSGMLTITKSMIANNLAEDQGGGIGNGVSGPLPSSALFVSDSTIAGNIAPEGGGIYNDLSAELFVLNSTLSSNNAYDHGGGIYNSGTLTVTNSTLSTNVVDNYAQSGGGIYNWGTLTLNYSTLAANSADVGANLYDLSDKATLRNTIIADSPNGNNCSGFIIDGGYNIEDSFTCGFDPANGSLPNTEPRLEELGNNGGSTLTRALQLSSPAIDAADPANCLSTDQRGIIRPIDGDWDGSAICDIGSFESPPFPRLFLPIVARRQ